MVSHHLGVIREEDMCHRTGEKVFILLCPLNVTFYEIGMMGV